MKKGISITLFTIGALLLIIGELAYNVPTRIIGGISMLIGYLMK